LPGLNSCLINRPNKDEIFILVVAGTDEVDIGPTGKAVLLTQLLPDGFLDALLIPSPQRK
jgi:hypothetical protein